MPKKKEENTGEHELIAPINTLMETMEKLSKAVDKLSERLEEKTQIEVKQDDLASQMPEYTSIEQLFPVPSAYYELVNTILNKEFKIKVEPLADVPAFQLIVLVPDKYSQISDEYRKLYKYDTRPKVIENSLGIVGVRDWLEKVFNSFNPTIQAQIVGDRTK